MECNERAQLLRQCATTMHRYTKASIRWQRLTAAGDTPEYLDCRDARERARVQAELSAYELECHESLHHCRLAPPLAAAP
jgi:hypothetical protein